jgi:hypothetical protein
MKKLMILAAAAVLIAASVLILDDPCTGNCATPEHVVPAASLQVANGSGR